MSSDIDEDCEGYSAPRRTPSSTEGSTLRRSEEWVESAASMHSSINSPMHSGQVNNNSSGVIHSYVNIVDRSDGEEKPALPARRDRQRTKPPTQRKSRSKDRDKEGERGKEKGKEKGEYERIKEREKELERIHRRSRELMMSPRSGESRARDGSMERSKPRVLEHHYRMSANNHPQFNHPPPPCHPPPPLPQSSVHHRYKSPSPAHQELLGKHGGPGGSGGGGPGSAGGMRRRVQSPNRRDFKDFSSIRDFRSPNSSRFTDEEEDSGADSMNDMMSNHSCRSPVHSSHMALVPYDGRRCGSCYYGGGGGRYYCQSCSCHPQNMQVAIPSNVEDRLLALEGDKDQLHLQVALLSDQLESQTDKISDLENLLDDKKEVLKKTEEVLNMEILNRSSLETQKLELLSEISGLKFRQTSIDRENIELRRKLERTLQLSEGVGMNGTKSLPRRPTYRDGSLPGLPSQPSVFRPVKMPEREKENTPTRGDTRSTFFQRSNSVRHSSVPNSIRQREKSTERGHSDTDQAPIATKHKGFKKILSKMRRANSGHIPQEQKLEVDKEQHRASTGSKMVNGWEGQRCSASFQPELPFQEWNADTICSWLDILGLYMYSNEVRRTVKDGLHLSSMTSLELETKLGIKHPLHRKKVMLAVSSRQQEEEDPCGRLDHQWVTRWLDDVGLPQYKDSFLEARVDGRVLNYLTVDDLFHLKVTNQLHHLSLKHGIQILRRNQFDPSVLKRRGVPGERASQIVHADVVFWTNHRVMEWLRHVDLSEYAPNLRGSGVHGALMVKENRFTGELLASLLSIPTSKTLLRRHLTLHFKDLVGPDTIQDKREAESQPDFTPLTPNTRAKHPKRGQFTLKRKKSRPEIEFDDMLCPIK